MIATATDKVCELLRVGNDPFAKLESASLRLNKFINIGGNDDQKRIEIESVCNFINNSKRIEWDLPDGLMRNSRALILKLEANLAIHLAGGILENAGMCIHPNFNCPYIPGSGVKGVARHAAWCKWKESQKEEDALNVAVIFGYPTGDKKLDTFLAANTPEWFDKNKGKFTSFAGMVAFLPAYPIGKCTAGVDIATSHHTDYYQGKKKRATDDENPIPLPFPVINKGSSFKFIIKPIRKNLKFKDIPDIQAILDIALELLKEGMTLYGAGAKTAAGYGWFSENELLSSRLTEKLKEEQEIATAKAKIASLSPEELKEKKKQDIKDKLLKIEETNFGGVAKDILLGDDETEQQVLIQLLNNDKKDEWKKWKKRAKKSDKIKTRVEKARELGQKFGKELI